MKAKVCSRCRQAKDARDFYPDRRRRDTLSAYCIACTAERESERPPRNTTVNRLVRRFAYRRAERDLRRRFPEEFRAFYEAHVAQGLELADSVKDHQLPGALRELEVDDEVDKRLSA